MIEGGSAPPGARGFTVLGRAAWASLARGRATADTGPPGGSPVEAREWAEVYVPLAHVVGAHLEARARDRSALATVDERADDAGPFVIAVGGGVAAGKSTLSEHLAVLLAARADRPAVEVVGTDGFLLPNRVLAARGILARKGFPESYDHDLLVSVLGSLAAGDLEVAVPRYSHEVFDIAGDPQVLRRPDIVILEGVNALAPRPGGSPLDHTDFADLRVYVDADEPDLRAWFVDRFLALIDEARDDPASFYAQWTGLDHPDARALAESVWEQINLVNLTTHILPSRERADIVLHKGADHRVTEVAIRRR